MTFNEFGKVRPTSLITCAWLLTVFRLRPFRPGAGRIA